MPDFVAMATRVRCGAIQLATFNGLTHKPFDRRKHLADISDISRVIAYSVSTFVAMATRASWA